MRAERDETRVVRSWLHTDEHESADRVLATVLALVDTTPQRRSSWVVRRVPDINALAKIVAAAAAVIVVAVIGINLLPGPAAVGGGGPTASPSPATPSASPVASPSAGAIVFPPAGPLAIDERHTITLGGVPLTFMVPTADWVSNGSFGIDKSMGIGPGGADFILWVETPTGVFSDPCAGTRAPEIGTSVGDLADAVAAVPGTDLVSGPTDVVVGGHPGKLVELGIPDGIGCAPESYYLWYSPKADNFRYATAVGETIHVWIVDVDGTPVWIDAETYAGAGPGPRQEIQQVIDSIRFE